MESSRRPFDCGDFSLRASTGAAVPVGRPNQIVPPLSLRDQRKAGRKARWLTCSSVLGYTKSRTGNDWRRKYECVH